MIIGHVARGAPTYSVFLINPCEKSILQAILPVPTTARSFLRKVIFPGCFSSSHLSVFLNFEISDMSFFALQRAWFLSHLPFSLPTFAFLFFVFFLSIFHNLTFAFASLHFVPGIQHFQQTFSTPTRD